MSLYVPCASDMAISSQSYGVLSHGLLVHVVSSHSHAVPSHDASIWVQLLVEKGADVNRAFNPESLPAIPFKRLVAQCPTALHLACDRGDIDLVKV